MSLPPLHDPPGHRWVSPGEFDCPDCRCCTVRLCEQAREQHTACGHLVSNRGPDSHDVTGCPCAPMPPTTCPRCGQPYPTAAHVASCSVCPYCASPLADLAHVESCQP